VIITEDPNCRVLDYAISSTNADVNEDGSLVIPADVTEIYYGAIIGSALYVEFGAIPPLPILHVSFEEGSQLTKVAPGSFIYSDLITVVFPTGLVEFGFEFDLGGALCDDCRGQGVFEGSESLVSVTFPCGSMTEIHADAFEGTDGVVIYMPDTVDYSGNEGTVVILDCPLTPAPSAAPALTPTTSEAGVDTEETHLQCGAGMYIKNKCKGHDVESCEKCQRGKFNNRAGTKNKRCKRCPENSYQDEKGATECKKCPPGFHSRNQRGEKQCFEESSGKSMKTLGYFN
jgi:hypothetical protein